MIAAAPLTAGELDELMAGCGQLTIAGRLDRGQALDPVLAWLARRPLREGYAALVGAGKVYRTRRDLGVGDPIENTERSAKLAALAAQWHRERVA
jgi:hypothetical protein